MEIDEQRQATRTWWLIPFARKIRRPDEIIASSGISFQLWRLYQHFWLVCLLFPLVSLIQHPASSLQMITGIGGLAFFATSYTWLMWRHPVERVGRRHRRIRFQLGLWTLLLVLAIFLSLTSGLSFLWLFIGVSAIAGILFPLRRAFVVVSLLMFLPPVLSIITQKGIQEVDWLATIALMLLVRALGLDMLGLVRLSSAVRDLHITRQELARLKVEEERQRLARDLHDVLGQTLSLITLKSQLAQCLVTEDPERCVQELADMERVARQTLRDVREAVAGYRQPTLVSELEGARQLLDAAGMSATIEQAPATLPPALDAALAWTIREGVTNVIRHSRARHCSIRLARTQAGVEAEVLNDGENAEEVEAFQQDHPLSQGQGLCGLRERVVALGGTIEAGHLFIAGARRFRLRVNLPYPDGGITGKTLEEEG